MSDLTEILRHSGARAYEHLPWWKKDYYGFPIEIPVNRPVKAFIRRVCINIKKPFQWVYWWWRKRKGPGKFETYAFPVIKRLDYEKSAKELVQLEPMHLPTGLAFYMDYKYDSKEEKKTPLSWNKSRY